MSPIKAALTLISGSGAGFVLRLVRNIVIARLISVEDYGIASTFTVAVSLLSMATNMSFGKLIVQSRAGDDDRFIHAVNGMIVARGLVMCGLLFVTAGLMARMFGQPDLAWAYQLVAVYPLLLSLKHSDIFRLNRHMRFLPTILSDTLPLAATVLLAWPLTLYFGDFRVMIAILMIEAVLIMTATHVLAERPYRLAWNAEVARQSLRFGWPLMLGSIAVFATQQGDRIIVANHFGAFQLGLFSAALTLTMPVCLQTALIIDKFFLPLLSRVQDRAEAFNHRALFTLQVTLCIGMAGVLGFGMLGAPVVLLVFGERYAGAAPMVGLVGAMFAMQILRAGATTTAIARGQTINLLVANIARIVFLPAAIAVAMLGGGVAEVVLIGIAGQITAYGVSLLLLVRWSGLRGLRAMALPYLLAAGTLAAMLAAILTASDGIPRPDLLTGLAGLLLVATGLACGTMWGEVRQRVPARWRW